MHKRFAAALDRSLDTIAQIQESARTGGELERPRWPMLVLQDPKGLDRPARGGRRPDRGNVALASGAACGCPGESRSATPARGLAAQLQARGALRRSRSAPARAGRAATCRRSPDERQPTRERRRPATRPRPARLPRLRGRGREAGDDVQRGDTGARGVSARRDRPQRGELPTLRTRRDGVQPPRRCLLRHQPHLGGGDRLARRPSFAGRSRDGDPLRAPLPGLARGIPPHRPPRPLQLLRGVHPHRRLDVQPAREVAQGDEADSLAATDRLAQLPARARTSGGRITTASRTRIPASSTMS